MTSFDEYIDNLTPLQRDELERLRAIVRTMAPDATEVISYGMPTFKYNGKPLIYFGAFKHHMSLFPTPGPTETLKEKFKDYKVSKGTIQFTLEHPLPESLIREIIKTRLTEIS